MGLIIHPAFRIGGFAGIEECAWCRAGRRHPANGSKTTGKLGGVVRTQTQTDVVKAVRATTSMLPASKVLLIFMWRCPRVGKVDCSAKWA